MQDTVEKFEGECRRLPVALKDKQAFKDLEKAIKDMKDLLEILPGLAKACVKERHWLEIMSLPNYKPLIEDLKIPYDQETFVMKNILEANLLSIKDEVDDITDNAGKQERLEKGLREIDEFWDKRELMIGGVSGVDHPTCVIGGNILETQEKLEEHTMQLQQYNAFRYVKPFQDEVTSKIQLLSETSDTIDKWLKVQLGW
jgi:dynein heavy chain, axonemal